MPIKSPANAKFANKNLITIIYGLPGVGKSTLALSAPHPFWLDVDQGAIRVRREHLQDYDDTLIYKDALKTLASVDPTIYKTVIIDTVGALIESMKGWAGETDPGNALKKGGGFALAGYGIIKSEFIRLITDLRSKFNLVLVFHASREKNKDDITYELVCEGAAKVFTWQPADLAAYMFIDPSTGKRRLGFTPTAEYSAKSGHGVKGLVDVPELEPGQPNDFLSKLFDLIRSNIAADDAASGAERTLYAKIMTEGKAIIDEIKTVADIAPQSAKIKALGTALTSQAELGAYVKNHFAKIGIVYNRETKAYEQTAPAATGKEGEII